MEMLTSLLFWTSIYLAIVGLFQWVLVGKTATPSQNRWFILMGMFASVFLGAFVLLPEQGIAVVGTASAYLLPEVVVGTTSGLESTRQEFYRVISTQRVLMYASLGISLILFLRLLGSLVFLLVRIRFNRRMYQGGCTILPLKKHISPFSFFGFVFVPEQLLSEGHLHTILLHEKAHIQKKHSMDLIFMEVLTVLFWFHPAIWYLRRELKIQHEYDADRCVLEACHDKKAYQKILLDMSFLDYNFPIANPFNYSPLKKRIMMMNKTIRKNRARAIIGMLMILPLFSITWLVQSCGPAPETAVEAEEVVTVTDEYEQEVIFTVVEEPPRFPGGESARQQFMKDNLEYPHEARQAGIQGTVFVSFVVEQDGSVSNVEVLRGVGGGLDEEAVRVVRAMPNWIPGRQRGEDVRVQFNMPIRFRLSHDEAAGETGSDQVSAYLIIFDDERYTISENLGDELIELIPLEEIGHIKVLTGEAAEPYGVSRVLKLSRKEEGEFFRNEQ